MTAKPDVQDFFDEAANTVSYVVSDPAAKVCAVVNSVPGYDTPLGAPISNPLTS